MPKKVAIGVVTSAKMMKTRRVEISRMVMHAKYEKYVRRRTVCYVHDENEDSNVGDTVEIIEANPRSKTKRWDLQRVVTKSVLVDVAAMRVRQAQSPSEAADSST